MQAEFSFLKKFKEEPGYEAEVMCSVCKCKFSIGYGGRRDILKHVSTNKHKSADRASTISAVLTKFFKCKEPNKDDLQCAAKEATFSYHTVQHDLSFKSANCHSKLICKLYDSKF